MAKRILKDRHATPAKHTFEQIEGQLYNAAYAICRKFPNRFEPNELVNEVWVFGDVQRVESVKYVYKRAYYDMVKYIRSLYGNSFMRSKDSSGNFSRNKHNMANCYDQTHYDFFEFSVVDDGEQCFNYLDNHEAVERALSCLENKDPRAAKVLRMYFLEEMILKDVAKEIGLSEAGVFLVKNKALETIRECGYISSDIRITDAQKQREANKKKSYHCVKKVEEASLVDILPEYISDFEIDNEYAMDEEFVLERDWDV